MNVPGPGSDSCFTIEILLLAFWKPLERSRSWRGCPIVNGNQPWSCCALPVLLILFVSYIWIAQSYQTGSGQPSSSSFWRISDANTPRCRRELGKGRELGFQTDTWADGAKGAHSRGASSRYQAHAKHWDTGISQRVNLTWGLTVWCRNHYMSRQITRQCEVMTDVCIQLSLGIHRGLVPGPSLPHRFKKKKNPQMLTSLI